MYRVTQFDNGLTAATAEMPHMASVSVGVWIAVGSRYETPRVNGICHFIEHLLFKGTKRRSAQEISQAVEGIGGYLNAFTSEENTCFHARAGHQRFEELLDVLMDMLLHSRFRPVDIGKERDVIKEEIAMYLDQPQQHVQELLNATLWPAQPLGRSITGTPQTLDGLTRAHLVTYLREHYVAGNTVLTVAGRVRHTEVVKAMMAYVRRLQRRPPPIFAPARSDQRTPRLRLFTKRTEQTQLALGIRTCSRHDERRFALRLLNTILGENMSSRLFQVIREDRGLAYSVYSSPSFFDDTGDLVISAGLETDNTSKTLKLIMRELRRLVEAPVTAGELRRARDYVLGQIDLHLESTDNQMHWLGEQWLGYGRLFQPSGVKRRLARVTARELQAVARDFFQPERLNLAVVSPVKTEKHLAAAMRL